MENINIEPIYKLLINDLKITDESLRIYGYKEEEIHLLVKMNIIQRLNTGEYKLVSVEKFRQYGLSLLRMNKKYAADKCFRRCYEMATNGKNISFQYINSLLKRRKHQEIFEVIDRVNPELDDVNYNLCLYLLSFLTDIPDRYKERIRNMTEDDLLMPMTSSNRIENNIRKQIIEFKFKYAYKLINDSLAKTRSNGYSIKFELIRELLKQVVDREETHKNNLMDLIKKSQYKEIILVLKDRQDIRYLSLIESYILIVAETIVEILETGKLPIPTIGNTSDMYKALVGKNFKVALELNTKFIEETNKNINEDIFNLLLVKLNGYISELKDNSEQFVAFEDNKAINDAMEMAYYIKMEEISLNEAIKSLGLKKELVLLIKLIYARDYYMEGKILEGDLLVKEVEDSLDKSYEVLSFIEEVKSYRDSDNKDGVLKRKLSRTTD